VIKLSDVLDKFYCPQADTISQDSVIGFCSWLGGKDLRAMPDAEILTAYTQAKKTLLYSFKIPLAEQRAKGFGFKYRGAEVFSDLFIPHCVVDDDGIAHFSFPGFGYDYVSSKQLGYDWRYLLMAWPIRLNVPDVTQVMFRVFYPSGHVVDAEVEPATWDMLGDAVLRLGSIEVAKAVPGSICQRCVRVRTCQVCQDFLKSNIGGMESKQVTKDKAYQLIIERVDVKTRMELLQQRERDIQASLKRTLGVNPELVIDGVMKVVPEIRSSTAYSNGKALFEVLNRAGLWKWDYVKVLATEVNDDLSNFPPAIRKQVLALRRDVHRDASITEVLNGVENHIQATIFRGISL
jgi:hypothetical protein